MQLPSVGILLELHRNGHVAIQVKKGAQWRKLKGPLQGNGYFFPVFQ